MIKTLSSIALVSLVTATFIGCSATAPTPVQAEPDFHCKQENTLAPKWTCVPMVDNAYAGVGIAPKSAAGMGHMRRMALANGRSDLAQQIESQVKDKIETFTRSTGNGSQETVDTVSTAVSKQVANVSLKGSKGVDVWQAPSGTLYMLVTVPESSVNGAVKNAVTSSMNNENALWQQFQSKQALENLEKEFPTH